MSVCVCLSVCRSVCWLVGRSVGWSVSSFVRSVGRSVHLFINSGGIKVLSWPEATNRALMSRWSGPCVLMNSSNFRSIPSKTCGLATMTSTARGTGSGLTA